MYTIQQISQMLNMTTRTIRYYDNIGLISPVRDEKNNYRLFSDEDMQRLNYINQLRAVDFSIEDIRKILDSESLEVYRMFKHHHRRLSRKITSEIAGIEKLNMLMEEVVTNTPLIISEKHYAVVMVNMQNEYFDGKLKFGNPSSKIPAFTTLHKLAHRKKIPVIIACDSHTQELPFDYELWGQYALEGTMGAEIISELNLQSDDYICKKFYYDAFRDSSLHYLLTKLGVNQIILAGLYTDMAIYHTAISAFYHQYKIYLPEDCLYGMSEERQKTTLDILKQSCGAIVKPSYKEIFALI